MAAGFGFAFLGVLAYAGLRDRPITDPGQLLLLRVVAAVSAAACAAMIPGLIELRYRNALRAGGAVALFAIIWFTNPPAVVSPGRTGNEFPSASGAAGGESRASDVASLVIDDITAARGGPGEAYVDLHVRNAGKIAINLTRASFDATKTPSDRVHAIRMRANPGDNTYTVPMNGAHEIRISHQLAPNTVDTFRFDLRNLEGFDWELTIVFTYNGTQTASSNAVSF